MAIVPDSPIQPGHSLAVRADQGELFGNQGPVDRALGFSDWRYAAPLCIGDTVHVEVEIAAKRATSKPGRGIVERRITLKKSDGSIAQQGTTQMMARCAKEAT